MIQEQTPMNNSTGIWTYNSKQLYDLCNTFYVISMFQHKYNEVLLSLSNILERIIGYKDQYYTKLWQGYHKY